MEHTSLKEEEIYQWAIEALQKLFPKSVGPCFPDWASQVCSDFKNTNGVWQEIVWQRGRYGKRISELHKAHGKLLREHVNEEEPCEVNRWLFRKQQRRDDVILAANKLMLYTAIVEALLKSRFDI